MSTETTPPPLTRPLSDAIIDALSSWTYIDYDQDDQEDAE